jgi:aryl-alcohol dehydrogenase-like predicted oxidoreductase
VEFAAALCDEIAMSSATASVSLGRSGLRVPRLALGTGTAGWARESDQTKLGRREFVRLLRHGVDRGASFIDTADLYGAHEYVKATLQELRREDVTVLSKIWFSAAPKMEPTETARPEVERFLKELGTDYLDAVLVHCVTDPDWPRQQARMRDELSELKARGVVRAVGCSCHSLAALKVAAEDPWVEVIFARINPGHQRMDPDGTVEQVAEALRRARANGKGVVGMKIYGSGQWRSLEQRRQSLELALRGSAQSSLRGGLVDAITIGHLSTEQIDDTIANMEHVLAAPPAE